MIVSVKKSNERSKSSGLYNIKWRSGQFHVFPFDGHAWKFSQLLFKRLLLLLLLVLRGILIKNFCISGLGLALIYFHFVINLFHKFNLEFLLLSRNHLLVTDVGVISASSIFSCHSLFLIFFHSYYKIITIFK